MQVSNIKDPDPGWGFIFLNRGDKINYFDQYYSFSECKWRSSTKRIKEEMAMNYIPYRRSKNIVTFCYCVIKKIFRK